MRWLLLILACAPWPALAAERRYSVSSFERIRVEGPFEVKVTAGQAPSGRAVADQQTLDLIQLDVQGGTLVVRLSGAGWGETPKMRRIAPVITLTTHDLRSAVVRAGGKLTVSGAAGQRVDLAVNGAGMLTADRISADQLLATVIGAGSMTLAGKAQRAQLLSNGTGLIDAAALAVNDLVVRQEGSGETRAQARYAAQVTTNGLGSVDVAGNPACTVKAMAGGPVRCGTPALDQPKR